MIARSSSIALAPPTRRTAKPLTILVVDRERSQLARTAEMLRAAHPALEIQMAANGREVFEALTSSQADLIAIDLELPDLDAIGLLSEICSFKRVPRVIVCADASAEQRAELRRSGALSTLLYPYDAADLIALIPSVLASPAGLTVAGFGSLLALTKKSRQLHLALGRESADLTFEDGVLVDAEWGASKGDAAAYEIFRWEHPRIESRAVRGETERRVTRPLVEILAEAARRESEDLERRLFGPDETTPATNDANSKFLEPMMELDGALGVSLIDRESGTVLAHLGGVSQAARDFAAREDATFVRTKRKAIAALGIDDEIEEILVTFPTQLHLIRTVQNGSNLFLSFQLDRDGSNLALARQRLDQVANHLGR